MDAHWAGRGMVGQCTCVCSSCSSCNAACRLEVVTCDLIPPRLSLPLPHPSPPAYSPVASVPARCVSGVPASAHRCCVQSCVQSAMERGPQARTPQALYADEWLKRLDRSYEFQRAAGRSPYHTAAHADHMPPLIPQVRGHGVSSHRMTAVHPPISDWTAALLNDRCRCVFERGR